MWSPQQEQALVAVAAWLRDPSGPQVFRLFGFAGTGKTTLAIEVSNMVNSICYGAFTGKAAQVMRSKGCTNASTIHGLIYKPKEDEHGYTHFKLDKGSLVKHCDVIVIDECSMVGEEIGRDLLSFGTKILVLGDPAQLPPVFGAGFFTHGANCEPDFMLTEIHRQAADNPIIHLATSVRTGEGIEIGNYGESRVLPNDKITAEDILAADQVIVGKNATRRGWNNRVRELKNLNPDKPVKGDKLICLKNRSPKGFYNGTLWDAYKVAKRGPAYNIWVTPLDGPDEGEAKCAFVRDEHFRGTEDSIPKEERKNYDEFTYGYCITCHKSQGSQFDHVLVKDESAVFRETADRWLYTAITRAASKLTLFM